MKADSETVVCASIAYPNRAAKSPIMHNAAFEALGLNYVYVAFEPTNLAAAIDGIRALGIHGVSVSKPFKETVLGHLNRIDPIARAIGAANTILNDAGSLIGFNSDWIGAVNAIEEISPIHGKKVVIVGAGGAARAIAYGVKARGGQVEVFDRTAERARILATAFEVGFGGGTRGFENEG